MRRRFWISTFLAVLTGQSTRAVDYTWNNTTGNWSTAGNWSPSGGPPLAADNATLAGAVAYTLSVDGGQAINNLTFTNASAILQISGGANSLTVGGLFSLGTGTLNLLSSGTLTNNGTFNSSAGSTINLTSGTVNGTGGGTWAGALNWNGATIGGSGTYTATGTTTINAPGSVLLAGTRTLVIAGGGTWSGGTVFMNTGTKFSVSGSTLQNTFDGGFNPLTTGGILEITGAGGVFTKSAGTGTTSIANGVDTTLATGAVIRAQTGTLNFSGNGTYAGTLDAFANATIDFSNSSVVNNFNAGATASIASTGFLKFRQGTFNMNAAMTIAGAGTFELSGGAIVQGAGVTTVTSPLSWVNATFGGSGTLTAQGGVSIAGGGTVNGTRLFQLDSAGSYTSGSLSIGSTATFRILPGRTLSTNFAGGINASGSGGVFDVQGTFAKTVGASNIADGISVLVPSGGLIDVQSGSLDIFTTGTYAGSLNVATGATLKLTNSGRTHNFNSGAALNVAGTGLLQFSASTYNFNADVTIGGTGTFESTGSGTIQGAGNITIDTATTFKLTSGTITGSGTMTANGTINIPGGGNITGTRTLLLNGPSTWTAGGFFIGPTATLRIAAGKTLDLTTNGTINPTGGSGGTFDIQGTFRKSASATNASIAGGITLNLASGGTIDVVAGSLDNNAASSYAGSLNVGSGTTLTLLNSGVTHTFNTGSSATIASTGSLKFSASTFNFAAPVTFGGAGTFEHASGTINGASTLTIDTPTTFKWSGGTIDQAGTMTANGPVSITGGGTLSNGRTLVFGANAGNNANWTSGFIALNSSSTLRVASGRTLDLSFDGSLSNNVAPNATFDIQGTFRKSGGTGSGASLGSNVNLAAGGTIDVQSGNMNMSGGGTFAGNINIGGSGTLQMFFGTRTYAFNAGVNPTIAAAAKLEFVAATFNVNTPLAINGSGKFLHSSGTTTFSAGSGLSFTGPAGTVEVAGGTMVVPGTLNVPTLVVNGGTLSLGSPSTVTSAFTFSSGSIIGAGNLSISGTFNWTGGTIGGSASNVDPLAATNLAGNSKTLAGGKLLRLNANSTWTAGPLDIQSTSILRVQPNQLLDNSFAASLTNAGILDVQGTFAKTGVGTTTISSNGMVTVASGGKLEVTGGTLAISSAATLTNYSGTTLTAGTYRAVGSTIDFSTRTIQTVGLNTTVELNGGTAAFASLNSLTQNNGTILVTGGNTFTPTAAGVNTAGTINVGSSSTFNKPITVQSGGVLVGGGTVAGVTVIQLGGSVRPGNSPGLLTVLNGIDLNGEYQFELPGERSNNNGVAGSDFDTIGVSSTGSVVVRSGSTFAVRVGVDAGPAVNLNSDFWRRMGGQQWTLAATTNGLVTGPGGGPLPTLLPGAFSLFDVATGQSVTYGPFGSFGIQAVNDIPLNTGRLELTWNHVNPVPEPATLLGFGALGLAGLRLARRRAKAYNAGSEQGAKA